ncbi:hypothetical protein GMST_02320 [Geomonas silvestris]|uniref:Uncharacterized protein n=1 Tax=Geomonas silvestris TaxID=2740184 RepID=A0A6V8MD79_9BACT|nr:hypothetical protein [Geomonas silvestris]GFO57907.1 hypothetical protein GMST_02320 [Geomonas silvestris]
MGIFSKFFGFKPDTAKPDGASSSVPASVRDDVPADDPGRIKVFDESGREFFIGKNQWLDNVLLANLDRHRDQPDELHCLLVKALNDGFSAELIPYAEHLYNTDPLVARGTTLLGLVYLASDRAVDAQLLLEEYLEEEGDDAAVSTALAKVRCHLSDRERAEEDPFCDLEFVSETGDEFSSLPELQPEPDEEPAPLGAAADPVGAAGLTTLTIEGPLWMRQRSPFAKLLAPKSSTAPRFMVLGSTVLGAEAVETGRATRLSRALPLLLAEVIHLASDAVGVALIPWAQGEGFAVFDTPCSDDVLCKMAGSEGDAPDYLLGVTIDQASPRGTLTIRLVRTVDGMRLAEKTVAVDERGGDWIYQVCTELTKLLAAKAGVRMTSAPSWYHLPIEAHVADYLMRLEQQLSLSCLNLDFLEGAALRGERDILDGVFRLCMDQPRNATVRMLCAQTLRLMNKVRPELLPAYRDRAGRLQRDYPVAREITALVDGALYEVFG